MLFNITYILVFIKFKVKTNTKTAVPTFSGSVRMLPKSTSTFRDPLDSGGIEAKRRCLVPSLGQLPKFSTENKLLQGSTSLISQRRTQLISSLTTHKSHLINPLLQNQIQKTTRPNVSLQSNLQLTSTSNLHLSGK